MRRASCLLLLAFLALLDPPRAAAEDKGEFKLEEGFELLFNGKDLTGWKEFSGKKKESLKGKTEAFGGRFEVKDGVIVIDPSVKGDLHVETERTFGEGTHIKFDFKPGPKCNNDLFIVGTKFDIVPGNKENKDVKEGQWYTFEIKIIRFDKFVFVKHIINGKEVRSDKLLDQGKKTPFRIRAEFGSLEIKNVRAKMKD